MYSEFTVNLINEVKKRDILYNTKHEKRPKSEKEQCWREIAEILNCTPNKAKNHWKNVRDRFVKVMHAREKHFAMNGCNIDAPSYIYFNKLLFLKDYSIHKDFGDFFPYAITYDEIIPDLLISEEEEDYTKEFLKAVQKHESLYDLSSELRKYNGRKEWKTVASALNSKFPAARLREYWIQLMKKYRLYQLHHEHFETIRNENIFQEMSQFVRMDHAEERLVDESIMYEETYDESLHEDQSPSMEEFEEISIEQPPVKRLKVEAKSSVESVNEKVPESSTTSTLDEFDYFGKKVSLQLKKIAEKNLNKARKAEIEILKLLMDYEDE